MARMQGLLAGVKLDVRYAWRVLAGSPAFTVVAVLSLALGIGANTVMYSVARYALLDSLPVAAPDELRILQWSGPSNISVSQYNSGGSTDPATGRAIRTNVNYATARLVEEQSSTAEVFAFNFISQLTVMVEGQPSMAVGGLMASGRYFPVLRPPLAAGRGLTPEDDQPSAPPVAVISHSLWMRAFGGSADALGRTIAINNTPFVIVGVTAEAFRGLSSGTRFAPLTDVTVPIARQPEVFAPDGKPLFAADNRLWLRMMARLPAGADETTVRAELASVLRGGLAGASFMPADALPTVDAVLVRGDRGLDTIGRASAAPLTILAIVVAAVLLIACVNLASLSLARGVARQRELAVRRALGASRPRLMRQLLIESLTIAVGGGAVGALLAWWLLPVVAAMVSTSFDAPIVALPLDWRTFAVTLGVAVAAGVLFGLLPAVGLTKSARTSYLNQRGAAAAPRLRTGRALLAVQIALSVPLVVAAGLLVHTVSNLDRVDLGFNPHGLVTFRLDPNQVLPKAPGGSRPAPAELERFTRDLLMRLEAIPGVASATLLENALVSGWVSNNNVFVDGVQKSLYMNGVGPRYFETMQVPLRAGRPPALTDTSATPRVAVINETAARQLFEHPAPLGRHFTMGGRDYEVIGVAADTKYSSLRAEIVPTMFDPFLQRAAAGAMHVVVRTRGDAAGIESQLRRAVGEVPPNVPITELRSQIDLVHASSGRERLLARLMSVFGGFALLLACIGLYGATAYTVGRRTNEIGVRVALGAQRRQVIWMVLRQVLVLAGIGVAIGIPGAMATGPLVGSLLFGVEPRDPVMLVAAAVTMIAVAMAAGALPARRAARVDVLRALRQE